MDRIVGFLKSLFSKPRKEDDADVESLRNDFRSRYHHFKLLLNANNKALGVMSEMEEALRGTQPFGMTFVLSRCTTISTNVWQISSNLNQLAPGKYEALYERFKEIQLKINPFICHRAVLKEGPMVIPLKSVNKDMADLVGTKMANLGELKNRMHLHIKNGFAITVKGYDHFMQQNDLPSEINRRIQATDVKRLDQLFSISSDIQQLIIRAPLPEELASAISEHYRNLEREEGKGLRVAMRSSALGEDLSGTSFAGQYRSELNVSGENILQVYKEIIAGKYGLPAMTYRLNRGIRDEDVSMCVGCMGMVDAICGGVMYSRNPLDFRNKAIVINSVWGLPKSVVDGSAPVDLFVVSREEPMEIIQKEIPSKSEKFICYPDEGVCRFEISGDESTLPSLNDDQIFELARVAVKLEDYYGAPQDMEWAIQKDGSIMLLQCRPLQQVEGDRARRIEIWEKNEPAPVILRGGVPASPGVASGPVFIVKKDMDALRFPEGGVLVSAQSLPRWATLLNRASAVVTGQGSVVGHLANVAREFGVPALFGVEGAMDRLKNGDLVTVDAEGMSVYQGRVDSLLKREKMPKNLMEGSPVHDALKGAAQHIVPLHLLDPDSPDFKPGNCTTLHDITRFCHEKAVHEMFQFGKEHLFPERSSKQLFYKVPMQWWVLNLDDGFSEEVKGKHVKLDNIASIPMLAFWNGFVAVPWDGPPAIDGKGFMSVMFQSTRNTALNPGVRSRYAARNYFMISRNYCNLNSRLGYHFSTMEALVSDRVSENYVGFQFKGGAADYQRRLRRAHFIGEILEKYDFRVEVREDNLIARIEHHGKEYMKERLQILGYLTLHTRQLDMIMANESEVQHYKAKIERDIRNVIGA